MFCPKCGHKFEEGAAFCPFCGTRKPDMAPSEPPAPEDKPPAVEAVKINLVLPHPPNPVSMGTSAEQEFKTFPFDKLEFEAIIGKTTQYYSAEFEKVVNGQKTKFNWAAFFFGPYFCLYRKCNEFFVKYFFPLVIYFAGLAAATIGLSVMSPKILLGGEIILGIGSIWLFINEIRFGKNFNVAYYKHCLSVLDTNDSKKYGTSAGAAILCLITIIVIQALITLPFQLSNNNLAQWGNTPTPDLTEIWDQAGGEVGGTIGVEDSGTSDDIEFGTSAISDYSAYIGSFTDSGDAESYFLDGGVLVELSAENGTLYYAVCSASSGSARIAELYGEAPMDGSSTIVFQDEDGWGNIVSGTIYLLDNGNIAVESNVIEEDPNAYWSLSFPYQELLPAFSDYGEPSDPYDILTVSFDDFDANKARARNNYDGQYLRITDFDVWTISDSYASDSGGKVYFSDISDLYALNEDDTITFEGYCTYDEFWGEFVFTECTLISVDGSAFDW